MKGHSMSIPPDSATSKPQPPRHVTTKKPASSSKPASSTAFDDAVRAALSARAAVEGLAPSTHGYETATVVTRDATMQEIASAHHVSLAVEEADNAQIARPGRLVPGEVVFSPAQSPVNATTTTQIQAAERADAALADAPAGQSATRAALKLTSQQQWARVQSDIADDLRAQANGKPLPDQVVQPTVTALEQWATGSDKLRDATQAADQQVDAEWQKQGITSQQLAPVLQARQVAAQDQAALSRLRPPTNRAIAQDEQTQAAQDWQKVQQATQQWLENTAGTSAFPEDAAAQKVKQLDALFPGDTKFAAANQAALQAATQTWNTLGITHQKLDPVLNAYNAWQTAVQQRTQALRNPHLHNEDPDAPALLNQQVTAAQSRLQRAIEQQLNDAAAQSGSPQGRSQAMLARDAILQMVGPQTADFRNAVDAADTDLQVTRPAQQIAAAYQQGGATAAAKALLTATTNAGPGYAGRIIAASLPTIDSMAADLNGLAQTASMPPMLRGGDMMQQNATTQFQTIYGDLSAAVEQTDHGTAANGLSQDTTQAADQVAAALASHLQSTDAFGNPGNIYANAAEDSVGGGQGASLSLAVAAALQRGGDSATADLVAEGSANGFDQLKTRTDGDVSAFSKVTANLEQLRASWGPFMTSAQLNTATADYAKHNPQFIGQFAKALGSVQQDGTEIVQARQAFAAYDPKLAGLPSRKDLSDAAANLTGSDRSTLFAVQESGLASMDVARAMQPTAPAAGAASSAALEAPGVARSARTFINQYLKSDKTTPNFSPSLTVNLGLSATGLVLTAPTALSELQNFSHYDLGDKAVTFYNTLGFGKYAVETLSQTAKTSMIRYLGAASQGKLVTGLAAAKDTGAFTAFSTFYYLTGAFANGVSAEEAASSGDPLSAGLDSATGLGNLLLGANAGKGFVTSALEQLGVDVGEDTAINAALDWAGPVGAGLSLLAQSGLLIDATVRQQQALDTLQSQGQQFLEDGLQLRPAVAAALADRSDGQQAGPAPALLAYARQYHMQPASLLNFLNQKNPADVGNFVYLSELMTPQRNGQYKATDSSDTRNLTYAPGIPFANTVPVYGNSTGDLPNPPASLRQLQYWAETIFGATGPRTS
jgi:hypothetical protein